MIAKVFAGFALLLSLTGIALADPVEVLGTANPFYAGRSDADGDGTVPSQVPISIVKGEVLNFDVTGGACNEAPCDPMPIDGGDYTESMTNLDDVTGLAGIKGGHIGALVGVFLKDGKPKPPAPSRLDFSNRGLGRDFTTLRPKVEQIFFIGDGLKGRGKHQRFIVPAHASRLFLAFLDGHEWSNNAGAFQVTVSEAFPK